MFTKEQLAKWRSEGFIFDKFYDEVAVDKTGKVQSEDDSSSRYDFLPVVSVNTTEDPKNAIICISNGKNFKNETINLGDDYDKDKKNYTIAYIVITRNSPSRIPLMVRRGYDPDFFQDEDGRLSFVSSESKIQMSYIDSEDTDFDSDAKKYNINDAENGDVFVLSITPSRLERGKEFTISVYATDNNDRNPSTRKGICGKFKFIVVQQDVFMTEEIDLLLEINEGLVNNDEICFRVADKELASLLQNSRLVLTNYVGKTGFDRVKEYKAMGYVKVEKYFNQSNIWIRASENGYDLVPQKYKPGMDQVFFNFISSEIKDKIGYHVYYFVLLDGYHVLLLIVNNCNPNSPKFLIVDQLRIRKYIDLLDIDKQMLEMTRNNYKGACDSSHRKDINSSIQLSKMKRK